MVYKLIIRFSPRTNEQKGICKISQQIKDEEYIEITTIRFEVVKYDIAFKTEGVFPPMEVFKQTISAVTNYFNIRYNKPIKIEIEDVKPE